MQIFIITIFINNLDLLIKRIILSLKNKLGIINITFLQNNYFKKCGIVRQSAS